MFGAFAAFIGPDSSFYPFSSYYSEGGVKKDDGRFIGCSAGKEQPKPGKAYHYGHYNWNYHTRGDQPAQEDRKPYEQLLSNSIWGSFPLRALDKNIPFNKPYSSTRTGGNNTVDSQNRYQYHMGTTNEGYWNVFHTTDACDYSGTMSIDDALKYINILCEYGTSMKPQNGSSLSCASRFKKDSQAYRK